MAGGCGVTHRVTAPGTGTPFCSKLRPRALARPALVASRGWQRAHGSGFCQPCHAVSPWRSHLKGKKARFSENQVKIALSYSAYPFPVHTQNLFADCNGKNQDLGALPARLGGDKPEPGCADSQTPPRCRPLHSAFAEPSAAAGSRCCSCGSRLAGRICIISANAEEDKKVSLLFQSREQFSGLGVIPEKQIHGCVDGVDLQGSGNTFVW